MTINLFYIILAVVISMLLAAFFYLYKVKQKTTVHYGLFLLRAIGIFLIFLLLLNLKITKQLLTNVKPKLVVLLDNSESIKFGGNTKTETEIFNQITSDKNLNNKFDVHTFSFGEDIKEFSKLQFTASKTNINKAIVSVKDVFNDEKHPILLITDGNQTEGKSYEYLKSKNEIFPIIIGDTTTFQDIKIKQLNANKYAYLKHKFPVEVVITYTGNKKELPVVFSLTEGKSTIYKENFKLGKNNNFKIISFYIPARKTGLHHYKARVSGIKNEKNTHNNTQNFLVEVISEKSKTLLVSSIIHPDIAMFKRAIESNEQRKLVVKKPSDKIDLNNYNSIILYQVNPSFDKLIKKINQKKKNIFFVTGTHTNWQYLNTIQPFFKREVFTKTENYTPFYNHSFNTFLLDDIGFSDFPPVQDFFRDISFNTAYQPILYQQINTFKTEQPLMASFEMDNRRFISFFGENIWRWRIYTYKNTSDFTDFDTFINKSMQYLSSNKKDKYLELEYKKKYFVSDPIAINAKVYDVNYVFNPKVKLWIKIKTNTKTLTYPFALKGRYYQVSLSDLPPGNYNFTVYDSNKNNQENGYFTVLDYSIEQQNTGGNIKNLQQLAVNTNGKLYFPNEVPVLIKDLTSNNTYKIIQKSKTKKKPLIDWKWLLGFIIFIFSVEWFVRKYKGFL